MHYRKQGLKALGLSFLAVLGFMVLVVSCAQASGKVQVTGLAAPFTVGLMGTADSPGDDRLRVLGLNVELSCPVSMTSGSMSNSGHGSGTIRFGFGVGECKAQGVNAEGKLIGASCTIMPSVIDMKVLALIILHSGSALTTEQHGSGSGNPYILFTPLDGLTFATVTNLNEECPLPESATIKGCFVAKIGTGTFSHQLINTREMLSLFGCALNYGANSAHLEADMVLELTGSHAGLTWKVE